MKKIWNYIKYILGITPSWKDCTLSSNWFGSNAQTRIMNILSPNFSDGQFKERVKFAKNRGVNCFHLFITNQKDGEGAGYSIYGPTFNQAGGIDKNSTRIMDKRIRYLLKNGYGIVLWMTADDTSWNKTMDFGKLCKDVKDLGWFDLASTAVVGLECDEYWSANQVANYCSQLKKASGLKVGVHQVSGKCNYAQYGDIMFYQQNPGRTAEQIKAEAAKVKAAIGKPLNFFELSRHDDRSLAKAAMDGGAFGVGNW